MWCITPHFIFKKDGDKVSKIYNDINESNYYFQYDNLKFYFSSLFYLDKFKRMYREFIKNETMKLRLKFKSNIDADELILILLYKNIEKRGFKVKYNEKELSSNLLFIIDFSELSYKE